MKIKEYLYKLCDLYDVETIAPALGGTFFSIMGIGGSIDYIVKRSELTSLKLAQINDSDLTAKLVNEAMDNVDKLTGTDMYVPTLYLFAATIQFYYASKNYVRNKENVRKN